MAGKKKTISKKKVNSSKVDLTTKILERAVKAGTKHLADEAKSLLGYTVSEKDGWVVKKYTNGKTKRVSKITQLKRSSTLVLD